MNRSLVAFGICCFLAPSAAIGAHGTSIKIIAPVEIVTKGDGQATAEIAMELTITNIFDRAASYRTSDLPQFVLFDAAGNFIDSFIVDTQPKEGESQVAPDKDVIVLEPKKSYTRKAKAWVRALAMEPGRCYQLGDIRAALSAKAFVIE